MTVHPDPAPPTAQTPMAERLLAWKASDLDAIAVRMLVEERKILARPTFQRAVVRHENSVSADWTHLSLHLDQLAHDEVEHQFLEILLAIALGRQILLDCVRCLDDRRLSIVLRALAAWAGSSSIAVGTRS